MEITIREFRPGEEKEIVQCGYKAFKSMEGLFISAPKTAKVAIVDGKIVGSMFYKMIQTGNKKVCYLAYAFIHPDYHGLGIGNQLYQHTIQFVREQGYEILAASVRGDNIGSYHLIEKEGLCRCSVFEMIRLLGFRGAVGLYMKSTAWVAIGLDSFCSNVKAKTSGWSDYVWYFIMNAFLFLCGGLFHGPDQITYLLAAITVMFAVTLFGAGGKIFSKDQWYFGFNNCGCVITLIMGCLGGIFPMVGKWYPKENSSYRKEKGALCASALFEWYGLMLFGILVTYLAPTTTYWNFVRMVIISFLVYRMIPTFPFSEYGGERILSYQKWIYWVTFVVSGIVLFLIG